MANSIMVYSNFIQKLRRLQLQLQCVFTKKNNNNIYITGDNLKSAQV